MFSGMKRDTFKSLSGVITNTGLVVILYLVRCELNPSVHINQLKGHSKVLVAVSCERALGFGRIVHPGSRGGQSQSAGFTNHGVMFQERLASLVPPCRLCADALVLVHHRQVHVGDSYLSGHLHFQLHAREHSYDS